MRFALLIFTVLASALALACTDEDPRDPSAAVVSAAPTFVATPAARPPGVVEVASSAPGGVLVGQIGPAQGFGAPSPPGLTVNHTARATIPADRAAIVVTSTRGAAPGPFGGRSLPAEDQRLVLERLAPLGVQRADVSFNTNLQFGPFPSISVVVPVADLKDRGPRIEAAIETVLGRSDNAGVQFFLADCNRSLEGLRRDALRGAEATARSIAGAAGVPLGAPIALSEGIAPSVFGPPSDPCQPAGGASKGPFGGPLADYEATPEVEAAISVAVTYALGDGAPAGIMVTGIGSATARADEAYVVAAIQTSFGPTGPRPVAARDRDALIERLGRLGIRAAAVDIQGAGNGPPPVISVEVDIAKLAQQGNEVLDAIEAVFGRTDQSGIVFGHSNCLAVLAEAQKQALVDARARATALSTASAQRLGGVVGLSTEAVASPYEGPQGDPCAEGDFRLVVFGPAQSRLRPVDAEPLFEVKAGLRVTYAILATP